MTQKTCVKCGKNPRKLSSKGIPLTMCEACQRDYWRRKKAESTAPRKPAKHADTPPKPRGRPRKLPNLKHPIKVLVVDRPSGWIGHAEVEATNLKPLSACRDEASIQRIIELFSRDGYVIQEIKE